MKAVDLGHIVTHYVNEKGDKVSHKKLQKLLYYIEAWHLVNFDSPILDEDFQAWIHGPVVPELYSELKEFGYNDLDVIDDENENIKIVIKSLLKKNEIDENKFNFINSVLNNYAGLSSFDLELLSHSELPWVSARGNCAPHERCTNIISKESMKLYYTKLSNGKE